MIAEEMNQRREEKEGCNKVLKTMEYTFICVQQHEMATAIYALKRRMCGRHSQQRRREAEIVSFRVATV